MCPSKKDGYSLVHDSAPTAETKDAAASEQHKDKAQPATSAAVVAEKTKK